MMDIINVTLLNDKAVIGKCNYIKLDTNCITLDRRFTFYNIKFNDNFSEGTIGHRQKIKVVIKNRNYRGTKWLYSCFQVLIIDSYIENNNSLTLEGFVTFLDDYYNDDYNQISIDVLNAWQNNESPRENWPNASVLFKAAYIKACKLFSGINYDIIDKDKYTISLLNAKDIYDIILIFSEEIYGERGYIGYSEFTFFDCMGILYQKGLLSRKKFVIIINRPSCIHEVLLFVDEIMDWFKKIKLPYEELDCR